jgi:hypothetical protein
MKAACPAILPGVPITAPAFTGVVPNINENIGDIDIETPVCESHPKIEAVPFDMDIRPVS